MQKAICTPDTNATEKEGEGRDMPNSGTVYWLGELRVKLLRLASEIHTVEGQEILDDLMKIDLAELQKATERQEETIITRLRDKVKKAFDVEAP